MVTKLKSSFLIVFFAVPCVVRMTVWLMQNAIKVVATATSTYSKMSLSVMIPVTAMIKPRDSNDQ